MLKKRLNKKGFTLAELLIVVAIIAVLTAVAIPVFSTQLEKSREATDLANLRSAYADATTQLISNGDQKDVTATLDGTTWLSDKWTEIDQTQKIGGKSVKDVVKTKGQNVSVTVNGEGKLQ